MGERQPHRSFEPLGARAWVIALIGLGVAALMLGTMAVVWVLPHGGGLHAPATEEETEGASQVSAWTDLEGLRRERRALSEERLAVLGWVDREAGVAQIPIDAAMRIVAEEGARRARGRGGGP